MRQDQKKATNPEPGHIIEAFSLIDVDGIPTSLEEISGEKGVVVGFLHGTYCPACMFQLTRSNRLADKLKKNGIRLAWILADMPSSIAAYRLAAHPSPRFAMLPDTVPSAARYFGVPEEQLKLAPAPYVFYIDEANTIRHIVDKGGDPHKSLNEDALVEAVNAAIKAPAKPVD